MSRRLKAVWISFGKGQQCKEVFQPQISVGMDEPTIHMENHPIFLSFFHFSWIMDKSRQTGQLTLQRFKPQGKINKHESLT
jgi:hypothetical protein